MFSTRLMVLCLLLITSIVALPVGGQESPSPLATINDLRDRNELQLVAASPALDALAAAYLEQFVERRDSRPGAERVIDRSQLSSDVRRELESDAAVVDVGLVVGYDGSLEGAIRTAVLNPSNGSVFLGMRMQLVGFAATTFAAGSAWTAPPPGGGPEIDLSGYTIVVILVAGTSD